MTASSIDTVVTRFAPSPTGYLHVGGARTALFSWLLARHAGGKFLLRIEDTDTARSTEQATLQLLEDLRWLGLTWDNAQLVYQSKRLSEYNSAIEGLMSRGLAYEAFETPEELDAERKAAEKAKKSFTYRRRTYSPEQIARFRAEGRKPVIRFAMAVQDWTFRDEVFGAITLPSDEAQDFVIRRSDGWPMFDFAVVVDDAAMGVTLVSRGQEHLKNTTRHIALQEALGYARPRYAHFTTIQNPDGSKMGKRDRDKKIRQRANEVMRSSKRSAAEIATAAGLEAVRFAQWLADDKKQLDLPEQALIMKAIGLKEADLPEILVHDFRRNGYLPEALLNFISLLGWNPGNDLERMSMEDLVRLFALDRVGKSNPKFDRVKLLDFNIKAAADAKPERLIAAFRDYLSVNPESPLSAASDEELGKLLNMKKGFRLLREVDEVSRFLFIADEQIIFEADAVQKNLKKDDGAGLAALRDVRGVLAGVENWTAAQCEHAVNAFVEPRGLKLGKVAQPLRVAITGTTISPPIFESLELLGRERTLHRIDRCLALS